MYQGTNNYVPTPVVQGNMGPNRFARRRQIATGGNPSKFKGTADRHILHIIRVPHNLINGVKRSLEYGYHATKGWRVSTVMADAPSYAVGV